jgi:predicted negative regulator of RcsB-dependent stress response
MEIYSTEEQQVEAIKKFWQENGTNIIVGAVLGVGGFLSWDYYVAMQQENKEAASVQYEALLEKFQGEKVTYDSIESDVKAFVAQYGESGYGVFVQLLAAKQAVINENLEQAKSHLSTALSLVDNDNLKELVSLRLARVEKELGQFDSALQHLAIVKSDGFAFQAEEVKGDIYLAQGNVDQARSAYQAAADKGGLEGNTVLEMKLNDLAQPTAN